MTKIYKVQMNSKGAPDFSTAVEIPSSDNHDWEKYSDKLWKLAYERGKASVRPQGEWLEVTSWEAERHSVTDMRCNICGKYASIVLPHKTCCVYDYCPNCGAQMKGADDESVHSQKANQ